MCIVAATNTTNDGASVGVAANGGYSIGRCDHGSVSCGHTDRCCDGCSTPFTSQSQASVDWSMNQEQHRIDRRRRRKRPARQHHRSMALASLTILLLFTTTTSAAMPTFAASTIDTATAATNAIARAFRQASLAPCTDRWNSGLCTNGSSFGSGGESCCAWEDGGCVHVDVSGCEEFGFADAETSGVPTPAPTRSFSFITPSPTTFPPTLSPNPTVTPTVKPSAKPTTAEPTTSEPTESPSTGEPTKEPTGRPTSKSPTGRPTGRPTVEPSASPSRSPSKRPTSPPTNQPTIRPSRSPTLSPSSLPSVASSGAPSMSPSDSPTYQPSDSPTQNPTISARPTPLIWPSASPTISTLPTTVPTSFPSFTPTVSPTKSPSSSPTTPSPTTSKPTTARPTVEGSTPVPTNPPTSMKTPSPTQKPTVPLQKFDVESMMVLRGADELGSSAEEAWTRETQERILKETRELIGEEGKGLTVEVMMNDQGPLEGQRRMLKMRQGENILKVSPGKYLRRLQASPLQINFSTSIKFISDEQDWDPNEMVAAGFRSPTDQAAYISSLKGADYNSFQHVETMQMEVDGELITEVVDDQQLEYSNNTNMYYIIAGAVGGGLLLLLVGGIYYTKLKKREADVPKKADFPNASPNIHPQDQPTAAGSKTSRPPPPPRPSTAFNPQQQQLQPQQQTQQQFPTQAYFGTIESREGEDDVSTLGDPYFGEGVNPEPRADDTVAESMISSELEMFGVARQRLNTGTSSRPGSTVTGGTRDNLRRMEFVDDPTLEDAYQSPMSGIANAASSFGGGAGGNLERLVVVAPAGKIGITIDNQTGDLPIVFGIKETSVLYGKVHVGDLLISVDEIDCRGLSAVQVSRLISSRSQNSTRTLALLRASS